MQNSNECKIEIKSKEIWINKNECKIQIQCILLVVTKFESLKLIYLISNYRK